VYNSTCPNCKNVLEEHSNAQLQQYALSELSKINRKNITFDGGDSENYIAGYFQKCYDSDDKQFMISMEAVAQQ